MDKNTTAHVVEPKYPGVVEQYVNLGECYHGEGLAELREEIKACMKGYKGCYIQAYRCLRAAAEVEQDIRATLMTPELEQRLGKRAQGILSRELKRKKGAEPGRVKQRFLGAVSHRGVLCLYDTVLCQCQRVYELSDRYGLGHELLTHLLTGAVNGGYDAVACPDPICPDRLAHVLIPQCSLAFVTTTAERLFPGENCRKLRLDAMANEEILRQNRSRMRFVQKMSGALTEEAVELLRQAKVMHDDLEGLYHPYVDFDRVNEKAHMVAEEILRL